MQLRHCPFIATLLLLTMPAALNAADGPKLSGEYQYTPGLNNTMLLLQGDVLIRLDADGVTEKEKLQLGAKYAQIAERADYFVALSGKSVVLLNKKTLKPIRERALPYMQLIDLALHPKLPIAYIAVKSDITAPSFRVIVFNESSAEASEPRGFYGTWVCVHPAGTFLITGHKDIYQRGTKFFINPGASQLQTMPDYGNIDLLINYALDDKGNPILMDFKNKAGGNGNGLRMSADGERVTYLSHVGTPEFSNNLGGFDPLDLQKLPVAYTTKDKATTQELAYHPRLPLCASPGNGIVVFFHRERGTIEERLDKTTRFDKVNRVYFSPDGKSVVVDSEMGGARALRNVAIKLSAEELAILAKPIVVVDNSAKVKAAMLRAHREIDRKIEPGKVAREKAIDWLKLNNAFGPNHKIVIDQTKVIDDELAAGRNFQLVLGKGLVKSGTSTFLCIWNDTFFELPLTQEQDKEFDFPKNSLVKKPGGKSGWRLVQERAQLHDLKFTNVDAVDGKEKLTGSIKYTRLDTEAGNYSLKIQYIVNDTCITAQHHLGQYLTKSEDEIQFTFAPILSDKNTHKGPLPVFVELVTYPTSGRRGEPAIVSNTMGQIIVVKGP